MGCGKSKKALKKEKLIDLKSLKKSNASVK